MSTNSPADRDMLPIALSYAERGWAVLPVHRATKGGCSCGKRDCDSPGKHPATTHGVKDGTTDRDAILEWWSKNPTASIGVRTGQASQLLVIDIDPRNGGDDTFDELCRELGPLPETLEVLSGGGGRHLYFRLPSGNPKVRTKFARGIEALSDGFYVVAPPSLHPSGQTYEWEVSTEELAPAELPAAWLTRVRQTDPQPKSPKSGKEARLKEGERNSGLTRLAGSLRHAGLDPVEIHAALDCANDRRCTPPLETSEVASIAQSIGRYPSGVGERVYTLPEAIDIAAFVKKEYVYPESLIGNGLLVPGGLGLLAGKPGIGKTWLTLDLVLATLSGGDWLDQFDLRVRACRSALISMELPAYALHQRLQVLLKAKGRASLPADAGWVLPDPPAAAFSLSSEQGRANLFELIARHRLELLILDPFSRFHTSDENAAKEVGEVLAALDAIRHETNCALLLVHHVRKTGESGREQGGLDSVRGSSRLISDPQTVLLFRKRQHGYCLTAEKVNLGPELTPQWFARLEDGGFSPIEPPLDRSASKESNLALIRAILQSDGSSGITADEILKSPNAPQVKHDTLLTYLRELKAAGEVGSQGGRKDCRWSLVRTN